MLNLDFFSYHLGRHTTNKPLNHKKSSKKILKKKNSKNITTYVGEGVGMVQNSKNNSSGTLIRG